MADGCVVSVSDRPPADGRIEDLGDVAVLPGLVNAHTHLELSWMAGRVLPGPSMSQWIQTLMRARRAGAPGGLDGEISAARDAVLDMMRSGTVAVGDISNSLLTPALLDECGLDGVVFHELIGFNPPDPVAAVAVAQERIASDAALRRARRHGASGVPATICAHAPYSVSPALFREIASRADSTMPLTVHLGESFEEIEFLRSGRGPMRELLEGFGAWTDAWQAPACDPVSYLDALAYLRKGVLVVHGVHLSAGGLARLREIGAVLVTCPRSNVWVGSGAPDISRFYASGVPVAIGTDSLASAATLNMFDELAAVRRAAANIAPARLLESATLIGARALGVDGRYGTIAPGKRAALVAVDIPADVTDVEEYLVSGVSSSAVRRIDDPSISSRGPESQ